MTAIANVQDMFRRPGARECPANGNVTRSLLGYLALAGPFYIAVSMVQALTRRGFSLARDEWSLLALGHLGWVQTANLILTGAMTLVTFAGIASGARSSAINLGFTAAVVASYVWLTAVAADLYRRTRLDEMAPALPAQ